MDMILCFPALDWWYKLTCAKTLVVKLTQILIILQDAKKQ